MQLDAGFSQRGPTADFGHAFARVWISKCSRKLFLVGLAGGRHKDRQNGSFLSEKSSFCCLFL